LNSLTAVVHKKKRNAPGNSEKDFALLAYTDTSQTFIIRIAASHARIPHNICVWKQKLFNANTRCHKSNKL